MKKYLVIISLLLIAGFSFKVVPEVEMLQWVESCYGDGCWDRPEPKSMRDWGGQTRFGYDYCESFEVHYGDEVVFIPSACHV